MGCAWPMVVLGGCSKRMKLPGRYIQFPGYGQKGHKTIGNWWTSVLNAYGNPIEHYGDFDPGLMKGGLEQDGVLRLGDAAAGKGRLDQDLHEHLPQVHAHRGDPHKAMHGLLQVEIILLAAIEQADGALAHFLPQSALTLNNDGGLGVRTAGSTAS